MCDERQKKLWQEHKESGALFIANGNMKCLSLCKRLEFYHKGKYGVPMWYRWFNIWYTSKSNENWSQTFYTNVYRRSIYQILKGWGEKETTLVSISKWLDWPMVNQYLKLNYVDNKVLCNPDWPKASLPYSCQKWPWPSDTPASSYWVLELEACVSSPTFFSAGDQTQGFLHPK